MIQILHAAVLLVVTRLALVSLGFQRTSRIMRQFAGTRRPRRRADPAQVQSAAYAIAVAAAFVPARVMCLERSLVLYYHLVRGGVDVALRLGVRAYPFAAHAWVVQDGIPINDDLDRLKDFTPIFELDG